MGYYCFQGVKMAPQRGRYDFCSQGRDSYVNVGREEKANMSRVRITFDKEKKNNPSLDL